MHISNIIIIMYTYINTYLRNNGAIRAVNIDTILCNNNNNRIAPLSERTEKLRAELRPGSRPQILAQKRRPGRQPGNCKLSKLICKCAL